MTTLNGLLPLLAIIAGIFVITTKNAIISVFNLIVLYILVSFYLIYIGVTYLGISYIIIYIGAIAILFLFIIMMIDIEVVEKRSNNYLPLLLLFLSGFLFSLKKILYNMGLIKMKSLSFKEEKLIINESKLDLYTLVEPKTIQNINYTILNKDGINNTENYNNNINSEENIIYVYSDGNLDNDNCLINDEYSHFYNSHLENENILNFNNNDNEYFFQRILNNSIEWADKWDYICLDSDIRTPWDWISTNLLLEESKGLRKSIGDNEIITQSEYQDSFMYINSERNYDINYIDTKFTNITNYSPSLDNHYLLIAPHWDSIINRITQITAIGDVLYTVYHSYIYIVSVILLLGMVGAIILTGDSYQEVRILNISKNKKSSLFPIYNLIRMSYELKLYIKKMGFKISNNIFKYIRQEMINLMKNKLRPKFLSLSLYYDNIKFDNNHSERIIGNLSDFIIAILLIAFLLLGINYYLSLSIKYLEKGGGFECGFTSFLQTRERYNIYFYRVSLLFLVFDLEIVLAFPYTAIYQKNQNLSKNNVLAFLFILIVGFIFELKEGALNIVKKAHSTEINIQN